MLNDGNSSHMSPGIIEWAREKKVVLFVLPPHTSHLLHPLDRICFSTLERSYKQAYQRYLRQNPIHVICKFNFAAIAGKAYQVGLNPCNLQGNFRRTGIFQFDPTVITFAQTHPFLIYQNTEGQKLPELREGGDNFRQALNSAVLEANQSTTQQRNTYKIVGGHTMTEDDVYEKIQDHWRANSCKGEVPKSKPKVKKGTTQNNSKTMAAKKPKSMGQGVKSKKFKPPLKDSSVPQILQINQLPESQRLLTARSLAQVAMHQCIQQETVKTLMISKMLEKIAVCGLFRPPVSMTSLIVFNWAQCDNISCGHWVPLRLCSPVQNTSSHDVFYCPHCIEEWVPSLNSMMNLKNDSELLWKTDYNPQRHGIGLSNNWIFLKRMHLFICFKINEVMRCNIIIDCIIVNFIYCYRCSDCIDMLRHFLVSFFIGSHWGCHQS